MNPLYNTHVWVCVTSTASGRLPKNEHLQIQSLTDTASIGGVQSVSFTLAGRTSEGKDWRDVIQKGDLIRVGGHYHTETGTVKRTLGEDLMITDVSVSETMQQGSYSLMTSFSAVGLQGAVLQTDAVAWWMYYGTTLGALRARGELMPDDLSGELSKVFANYMNKVALNDANWKRDNVGLKKRIGYHFKALKPNVPLLLNLTIAEGTHWDILAGFAELRLHEFFVQQRRQNDPMRPFSGGFVHHATHQPKELLKSEDAGPHDNSHPYVILRPAPFPYADKNGKPVLSEWEALPMHDFTERRVLIGSRGIQESIGAVRNFVMVYPGYSFMDDKMAFTQGIAVHNPKSIQRYGYRPAKFGTNLVLNEGSQENMMDLARELTWRVATQLNRTDEMMTVSVTTPFAPNVQHGERVRFRLLHADGTDAGIHMSYVSGRTHQYQIGQGALTTLQLERVLPEKTYKNGAWFVQGLEKVEFNWPTPKHGE